MSPYDVHIDCRAFLAVSDSALAKEDEGTKVWYTQGVTEEVTPYNAEGLIFRADVTWRFLDPNTGTYSGSGGTREGAFEAAKQLCIASQTIDSWKGFCFNKPVKEEYFQVSDCGDRWTGWIEIGGPVGNPCDAGCQRGNRLGDKFRLVGLPARPQYKTKFQCYRTEPATVLMSPNPD